MTFVYLDREFDGNNNPTKFYRISIDKNRNLSPSSHHCRLVPFHDVRVLEPQKIKTRLLKQFNKYRIEDKTKVRNCLELSIEQRDEVQMAMDSYKESQPEFSSRPNSSPPLDLDGWCIPIVFILLGCVIIGSINSTSSSIEATTSSENVAPAKYEGIIDASFLGSKFASVRSKANEESTRIKVLGNGKKVFFMEKSKKWVYVVFDDGSKGWIASNLIKNKKRKSS